MLFLTILTLYVRRFWLSGPRSSSSSWSATGSALPMTSSIILSRCCGGRGSARSSERLSEDQLNLVLEELETASAKAEAEEEKKDEGLKRERAKKRRANRGSLPCSPAAH